MPQTPVPQRPSQVSQAAILASLQTVLQSKTFSRSPTLRQALEFVVRSSLASPTEPIKEYSVATEAFGRGTDFDPKTDNVVRVQMHRLREKLDEFYLREGQGEQIRMLIPRGQYNPEYVRTPLETQASATPLPQAPALSAKLNNRRMRALQIVAVVLLLSNVVLAMKLLVNTGRNRSAALGRPLHPLWAPFLSPESEPLIVYANPAFWVDKRGNLYRYSAPDVLSMAMGTRVPSLNSQNALLDVGTESGPFYYFDSYTGTGELVAASGIARFLALHGQSFVIERSRLVSDAEIMRNNVIFLGGNKEDRLFRKLPLQQELVFRPPLQNDYPVGSYIEDMNPPAGHPATYHLQLDPSTGAIEVEYGLISVLPNVSTGHYVLDLGGLTTLGTQAAADFVTSQRDMALLESMRTSPSNPKSDSSFFQALLEISVRDGVPLKAKCLLVRELHPLTH
jgi:hypothetical protein